MIVHAHTPTYHTPHTPHTHTHTHTPTHHTPTHHTHTHSGIVLKDLVAIDAQGKDMSNSSSQMLNMSKFRLLWSSLSSIRKCQATSLSLAMDIEKMRILRVRDGGMRRGRGEKEDRRGREDGEGKRREWLE